MEQELLNRIEKLEGEINNLKDYGFFPLETLNVLKRFFPTVIYGSATLDFGNVNSQGSTDLTISVNGATVGDPVALSIANAAMGSGNPNFLAWVSSDGVVSVRYINAGNSATDPASGVFNVAVIKLKP